MHCFLKVYFLKMISAFVSQCGREGWRWYNDACHYKAFTVYQTVLYTSSDMHPVIRAFLFPLHRCGYRERVAQCD